MIIHRYILRNLILPFVFASFTLIGVFLLQFLMKFADRLVGKGLSLIVIFKLISFNLAWMVVLVIPMAVLVATLMAFGSMAQNNEIAILKASGVSLYKMMIAPVLASILVAFLLVQFNNYVYPNANHASRILLQEISKTKPTLSLVPGVFSQEVKHYAILTKQVNPNTNELEEVTIYDYSQPQKINIVTAKTGELFFSKDHKKLIMNLYSGEIHQSERMVSDSYRRIKFEKHRIAMNADDFSFQQSTFKTSRGDREIGAQAMLKIVDSLQVTRNKLLDNFSEAIAKNFNKTKQNLRSDKFSSVKDTNMVMVRVENRLKSVKNSVISNFSSFSYNKKEINRFWVEIHKKYALPFACIVFVIIGAPLGTMTRKGGIGIAAGISLVFFLIYWAFLIGGEKLADRGMLSPFWGVWSANILMLSFGIWIAVKSAKERITLNFNFLQRLIPKSWREEDQDS